MFVDCRAEASNFKAASVLIAHFPALFCPTLYLRAAFTSHFRFVLWLLHHQVPFDSAVLACILDGHRNFIYTYALFLSEHVPREVFRHEAVLKTLEDRRERDGDHPDFNKLMALCKENDLTKS